jgi:hypothetical protein
VEVVSSEYWPDLSCFPTEKQFVSHATLAPRLAKSGSKPVRKKKSEGHERTRGSRFAHWRRIPCATAKRPSERTVEGTRDESAQIAVFGTARKSATLTIPPAPIG